MNIRKLQHSMEVLKANLGPGLLASDIYSAHDGQCIIALDNNPQPIADALFTSIINMMQNTLQEAKFPSLNRYVIMDMEGGNCGIILPLGEYQWGLLVDTKQCQLGLILNVAIPKALAAFEEAKAED
ncbi:MAG: hypothetical protein GY940_45195 [bacterium]|nr:hypothetical protein [bacterium]